VRAWFAPILLILALITGWGQSWKPHSQFTRFAIPMFFVAVAPAAMLIGRLLRARDPRLALVRSFLVVLLVLGAYNVTRIYENEGRARYVVPDETIETMSDWVRREVPEGGRLLFAGRCVHAFGRGNVAYLPILTGREMMADDYYGFPAGTIEYEYPPRPFRTSLDRMQLFFDAYNVTHVVTYHENWKRFFREHPALFREEWSVPSHHLTITFYTVLRTPRPLFEGRGRATARFNRIDVKLDHPADEVVLPYNWIEGLEGVDGVDLYPRQVDPEITLIGCRPRGRQSFSVVYRNWF